MKADALKFKYRPKYFKSHLYGGTAYLIFGLIYLLFLESSLDYFFISFSFLMIISYYHSKNFSYIEMDNHGIKIKRFIPKRVTWQDYKGLRFYGGYIRVLSKNQTIDINKEFLTQTDVKTIEDELKARIPKK